MLNPIAAGQVKWWSMSPLAPQCFRAPFERVAAITLSPAVSADYGKQV